ncbi:MAG: PAQR family membrane homeostasis protein TrhA, partial [Mycobacterium sp.]
MIATQEPTTLAEGILRPHTKPRARGWIHLVSAVVALAAGASLISVSWPLAGLKAGLVTFVYIGAVVGMFTVSAIYHRVTWKSVAARTRMKRLDHSMIFVLIAGTYTPFAVLAMPYREGMLVLTIVWGGAIAGVLLKVCWPTAPRWVGVPLYLLLGWVAAFY